MRVCAECGKENLPHHKFCLGCGAALPAGAEPDEPIRIQPVPAPAPQPERCGHCGFKVSPGAARCPSCNAPL